MYLNIRLTLTWQAYLFFKIKENILLPLLVPFMNFKAKPLNLLHVGAIRVSQKIIWMCCWLHTGYCGQSSLAGAECDCFLYLLNLLFTTVCLFLQLVVVRANLNGHLKALKDYFLLEKGDFFQVKDGECTTSLCPLGNESLLYGFCCSFLMVGFNFFYESEVPFRFLDISLIPSNCWFHYLNSCIHSAYCNKTLLLNASAFLKRAASWCVYHLANQLLKLILWSLSSLYVNSLIFWQPFHVINSLIMVPHETSWFAKYLSMNWFLLPAMQAAIKTISEEDKYFSRVSLR